MSVVDDFAGSASQEKVELHQMPAVDESVGLVS